MDDSRKEVHGDEAPEVQAQVKSALGNVQVSNCKTETLTFNMLQRSIEVQGAIKINRQAPNKHHTWTQDHNHGTIAE